MNNIWQWLAGLAVRQAIGTKKGAALEATPVFQTIVGIVVPHLVQQAGGDKLTQAVNTAGQVVQLIQAGAQATQGQTLADGFTVPQINIG